MRCSLILLPFIGMDFTCMAILIWTALQVLFPSSSHSLPYTLFANIIPLLQKLLKITLPLTGPSRTTSRQSNPVLFGTTVTTYIKLVTACLVPSSSTRRMIHCVGIDYVIFRISATSSSRFFRHYVIFAFPTCHHVLSLSI